MSNIQFICSIINRKLNVIYFMCIFIHMETETKMLDKYMRNMFPFIINVSDIEPITRNRNNASRVLIEVHISIYVSPSHFCELMDNRVEIKMNQYMLRETSFMIKSLIPNVDENKIKFLFFPDIDSVTIFDNLTIPIN
jgi:hypothetical protein